MILNFQVFLKVRGWGHVQIRKMSVAKQRMTVELRGQVCKYMLIVYLLFAKKKLENSYVGGWRHVRKYLFVIDYQLEIGKKSIYFRDL